MRASVSTCALQAAWGLDPSGARTAVFVSTIKVPPCEIGDRAYYILTNKLFVSINARAIRLLDPFLPRLQEYPMPQAQQPRIGIVIGSTREGRFGEKPAQWIYEIAKQRTDLAFELIDLRDHPLPFFNEPMQPRLGPVNNEAARRGAGKLATLDGLIMVTPEYNHGPGAVLKNALDYAYTEFVRKPIGFVGYGGGGGGRGGGEAVSVWV